MNKPTLQDILEEGIRYYAQLEDFLYQDFCNRPVPDNAPIHYKNAHGNRLTILDVLNKGVQHYVQIAREEYKKDEKKSTEPKKQTLPLIGDWPDSSEGRRYE